MRNGGFTTGIMAVNLRNKRPDLKDEHIGNYEWMTHYFPSQFATPEGIRKPLANGAKTGQLRTSKAEFFSSFTDKFAKKEACVTNWSSFFQEIDLPECKPIFHMPLIKSMPLYGGGMAIFQATKERIGVFMWGDTSCIARVLKEGAGAVDTLA